VQLNPAALVSGGADDGGLAVLDGGQARVFELPHLGLLDEHPRSVAHVDEVELRATGEMLEQKLADFGITGEITAIRPGPVITTYEYLPSSGIKLSRISALEDDIAMALKALCVRIVAPIPGKGVVGFEVPNKKRQTVWVRDILASESFRKGTAMLPIALGKSVEGKPEIGDLASCPHLLVAGTTGSGKSVGVNAMLMSMLFTRTPEELRLILIDPKMLEFELYQDIPHLLHPVVTDPKLASAALKWACGEMDERYKLMARWQTRNIASYNQKVEEESKDWSPQRARRYAPRDWPADEPIPLPRRLPYIVVVIDELADLMMVAAKDVEVSIARLAQKARAAGIHLIVATQRPEKTVVTGIIKANLPSRIAFQVRSKLDGRIILDQGGAEALLGKGDMLFLPPGVADLMRIHGPFVADEEVRRVNDFLRSQGPPNYEADIRVEEAEGGELSEDDFDPLYDDAVAFVTGEGKASTSMIQRQYKIGYNRAARILEIMEKEGVVGPADGARPREVLVGGHR
jgi:S-DNA-T family DNA segregation ATPase FtsK/SpoIIIE